MEMTSMQMVPFLLVSGIVLKNKVHTLFYKEVQYKKLVVNFLPNYNRNAIGYCSHNNREEKENEAPP